MNSFKKEVYSFGFIFLVSLLSSISCFGNDVPLKVSNDGKVSVNTEFSSPKVNISSVLHLSPMSNPPSNPVPGDIYFTTTEELLIYAGGKWNAIHSALAAHGTKSFTSGSGTWSVPAGIYSIKVSMVGGGGGGGPGMCRRQERDVCLEPSPGGRGGNGGVRLLNIIEVVPGQVISYSVGSGGAARTKGKKISFGGKTATGGGAGNYYGAAGAAGSPQQGSYPYGSYGTGGSGGPGTGGAGQPGKRGAIFIEY